MRGPVGRLATLVFWNEPRLIFVTVFFFAAGFPAASVLAMLGRKLLFSQSDATPHAQTVAACVRKRPENKQEKSMQG
jgi:hypothetical protein